MTFDVYTFKHNEPYLMHFLKEHITVGSNQIP